MLNFGYYFELEEDKIIPFKLSFFTSCLGNIYLVLIRFLFELIVFIEFTNSFIVYLASSFYFKSFLFSINLLVHEPPLPLTPESFYYRFKDNLC